MTDHSNPLLVVEDYSLDFVQRKSSVSILRNVSFEVGKGEIVGVVGESGSGKTITSLSIMQLLVDGFEVKSGSIQFCSDEHSVDLLSLAEDEVRKYRGKDISMIFQEPMTSLNPSHRCGAQVLEAILIHQDVSESEGKKQVLSLFEKVKLPEVERVYQSYPHQLSGGQLQRIVIAMAIANKPKLIIADEPTTALDVTVQASILQLLRELKNEFECSIIFISHDLSVVRNLCDRVVVMQHGRVVEKGNVQAIFEDPAESYTRGLIECRPPLRYRMRRLPTVQELIDLDGLKEQEVFLQGLQQSKEEFDSNLAKIERSKIILEGRDMHKWYVKDRDWLGRPKTHTKAVNGVNFQLREGEVLGLVGESGCGKSTLGKTILRLVEATSGQLYYHGEDIFTLGDSAMRKLRKDLQIIFQDPYSTLNPRFKIGEAIREPMSIFNLYGSRKSQKEKAIELLEKVGMKADAYDRYPHQFSGGQRQRISIARALAVEPKFILCDESVSALDVSVQAQVLNLLLDMKEEFNLSYIFVSHDISVIKFISDNVLVMKDGVIVEKGNAEQIYNNPQQNYTQKLIEAVPR